MNFKKFKINNYITESGKLEITQESLECINMNYSWSFRTCGLLFKNMPNCHKFEGDVDIYELPS
jgi:hypothetical protein